MSVSVDERLQKNTVASANADGSKKKSSDEREAEREALHQGLRKYSKAAVCDADAAMNLLKKAPNTGGKNITNPAELKATIPTEAEAFQKMMQRTAFKAADAQFDPFAGDVVNGSDGTMTLPLRDPFPAYPEQLVDPHLHNPYQQPVIHYVDRVVEKRVEVPSDSEVDKYLATKKRIAIKTNDGTFMLSVVDIKYSPDSIVVLLPLKDDSVTFIPNKGTEMTITWRDQGKDHAEKVYFPGTVAEFPELGVIILSMIVIGKK